MSIGRRNFEQPDATGPDESGRAPRMTPAVVRAFQILQLLREGPLSVADMARSLQVPRSSVHELVATLEHLGSVAPAPPNGSSKRYQLGLLVHELGAAYLDGAELTALGQEVARSTAAACGETAHLAVLDGREVVYIAKVDSIHPVRMVSAVGRRIPAHCTGVGKALLCEHSIEELRKIFGRGALAQMTPNSIDSFDRLVAALAETRERGVAYDTCESNANVCCVAAPVRDHRGTIVAGLSISVPTVRVDADWPGALAALVRSEADSLSKRLGAASAASA